MKKILVLAPRFIYPVTGGDKLRIYNLCRELSKKYSLTLLSLCDDKESLEYEVPNDGVFDRVERVYHSKLSSYVSTLFAIPTSKPLQVAYYESKAFRQRLDSLVSEYDGIFCHLIRVADYVSKYDMPKVIDMTDAISMNYSRLTEVDTKVSLKSIVFSLESRRLLSYERNVPANFDLVTLISSVDKDYLFSISQDNVLVCTNGVDFSNLSYVGPSGESKEIVFIGNMNTLQNQDACHFFIEKILSRIKGAGYTFKIVGVIDDKVRQRFSGYDNVHITGRVDSISQAVKGAAIAVCPMRVGAGVQNKVLEYMALGLPVISTSLGIEGIPAIKDEHYLLADTPDDFICAVKRATADRKSSERMAAKARELVVENHAWSAVLKDFMARVSQVF
ncbi:glycosyltransferase family 4 protein [Corallincola platygyrae]|uniref:Glycosyltransferase family 4 protein n=1 Tax=Corallincola platygyrae TaxID=1193278 RepID=A0ABW4XGW6_9GAMM